jgi:hypothetical protein
MEQRATATSALETIFYLNLLSILLCIECQEFKVIEFFSFKIKYYYSPLNTDFLEVYLPYGYSPLFCSEKYKIFT